MNKRLFAGKMVGIVAFMIALIMLLTTFSFAWLAFYKPDMDASKVGGQLLKNYFHSGEGTEEKPFTITRPIHYYNLVHLYQRVSGYSNEPYHFQLGAPILSAQGDETLYVFNYDDDGNLNINDPYSTSVLNLSCYSGTNALLPIGTHDKNFIGEFDGKGFIVKNLTVSTLDEFDCDIGIFGYVGDGANIHDVYYDNVTIDLSNVRSTSDVIDLHSAGQTHRAEAHVVNGQNVAYVGYIAGHAITAAQITDVYINYASIVGGGPDTAARSGFGYFGCLEDDNGSLVKPLGDAFPKMQSSGITMNEIYERTSNIRDDDTKAETIPFEVSKSMWVNGSITKVIPGSTVTSEVLRAYDTESAAGSFVFSKESSSSEGTTVYLAGKGTATQTVTTFTVTPNNDGIYFTNQAGDTYLTLNATKDALATTKTQGEATIWAFKQAPSPAATGVGYYFTTVIDDENCCCYYYYLTAAKEGDVCQATITKVTVPTADPQNSDPTITQWTYNNDNELYCTIDSKNYYLKFSGEQLGEAGGGSTKDYIKSEAGNKIYYLVVNDDGSLDKTEDESRATKITTNAQKYLHVAGNDTTRLFSYDGSKNLKVGSTGNAALFINEKWILNGNEIYYDTSESKWMVRSKNPKFFTELFLYKNADSTNNYLAVVENPSTHGYELVNVTDPSATVPSNIRHWTLPEDGDFEFGHISTTVGGRTFYLVGTPTGSYTSGGKLRLYGTISITESEAEASLWFRQGSYICLQQEENKNTSSRDITVNINGTDVTSACYLQFSNYGGDTSVRKWKIDYSTGTTMQYTYPTEETDVDTGDGDNQALSETAGTITRTAGTEATPILYQTVESSVELNGVTYPEKDTWFPVLVNNDGTLSSSNFGYVVSGMNHNNQESGFYQAGDIHVTVGDLENIRDSYWGGIIFSVNTVRGGAPINAGGVSDFDIYDSAVERFQELLNDSTSLYGLRFMSSVVDGTDIVPNVSATVNGAYCADLPRHCVDVVLPNNGYITMFAGNYDQATTSFFSLYHVTRNELGAVSDVKKISKIYKVVSDIHYVYADDANDPYNSADLVFDAAWMSETTTEGNGLYYFEIPVLAGEYAIGSEGGENGAYLLYLDVANAVSEIGSAGDGLAPYGFNVDVRSPADTVDHSLLQFAVNAPAASSNDFSIDVSFTKEGLLTEYQNGLYTIYVVNRTNVPIDLTVYLCDDNEIANDAYYYAYQVVYTNNTDTYVNLMNGSKNYFKSCEKFSIP